jgi:UDP-N-acetylglucosamine 2-epimerase (non-hydrolysing)
LIHTGQHYDEQMSDSFFKDLGLPAPHVNLEVGSASHATQTAEIMKRFEPVLLKERPDVMVVVGDVNSTVACALVASKIPFSDNCDSGLVRPLIAHVEAGLRSFDRSMPEEINRILTDAVSDFLFTSEEGAEDNLLREGIPKDKIHFVGNTMVDTLLRHKQNAQNSQILSQLGLRCIDAGDDKYYPYAIVTLHRPSNVDDQRVFHGILEALIKVGERLPVLFPIHPRTAQRIIEYKFEHYFDFSARHVSNYLQPFLVMNQDPRIIALDPLGYLEFLCLMSNAKLVLTDSGGIQEETTALGVRCITLRNNTERPITITHGTNVLAGTSKDSIVHHAVNQLDRIPNNCKPKYWDGGAGARIVSVLVKRMEKGR